MKKLFMFIVILLFASTFSLQYICYAKQETELKIYSEIKDIKIYVDEQFKGSNITEIKNINPGSHYIKVTKDNNTIYSKVIDIPEGQTTTILIEAQMQSEKKAMAGLYEQQLEYKNNRLEVLVKSSVVAQSQTYGTGAGYGSTTGYKTGSTWAGYSNITGYGAQNTTLTVSEVSDWAIVKGGLEKMSDVQFLTIVDDKPMLDAVTTKKRMESSWATINGLLTIIGFGIAVSEYTNPTGPAYKYISGNEYDQGKIYGGLFASYIFGSVCVYYSNLNNGYHIAPTYAAEKAYKYNLKLKEKLGLPKDFEPQ